MGYGMTLRQHNFRINAPNKPDALAAIKLLDPSKDKGSGGTSIGGVTTRHFGWVHTDEYKNASSLEEAMEAFRWVIEGPPSGDIDSIEFLGEKSGDDIILFKAIAPFVVPNSFIEMEGEDGELWRWIFKDGRVEEISPTITW